MEITEINMLSDFEAGMKCLQNPYLQLSRFSSLPQLYSFFKWGAFFLAFFATFTSIIRRIKLSTLSRFKSFVSPSQPLFTHLLSAADYDEDFDFSDVSSSGSVSDDSDDEVEFDFSSSFEDKDRNDEDFRVAGNNLFPEDQAQNGDCTLPRRNRFSWSDFASGKSVVKLWDSFGFGMDFEENYSDDDESEVCGWDFDSSNFGRECTISSSPAVFLSADVDGNDGVVLGAYDTRMGRESPAIYAEWRPRRGKKYIMDGALTVGDLRNVRTPLRVAGRRY